MGDYKNPRRAGEYVAETLRDILECLPDNTIIISKQNPGSYLTLTEVGAGERGTAYLHIDQVGEYVFRLLSLDYNDPMTEIAIQDSFRFPAMHIERVASGLLKIASSEQPFSADVFYRHSPSLN